MNQRDYIVVANLIKIRTNIDSIHYYSFGDCFCEIPSPIMKNEESLIHLGFFLSNNLRKPRDLTERFSWFYGGDGKRVYYEQPLWGKVKAKLLLQQTDLGAEIIVNKAYYHFVRLQVEGIVPPGIHLTDLTMSKLLEKGYLGVHAGCISVDGEGVLLFGTPDSGKSTAVISAVKRGHKFVSDDVTVISQRHAYSCPYTSGLLQTLHDGSLGFKLYNLISRVFILSYFMRKPKKTFSDYLRQLPILRRTTVGIICILERGKNSVEEADKDDFRRRLLILNREAFSYYCNKLMFASSYFDSTFDLRKLMEQEESILQRAVDRAACYIVRADDPNRYVKNLEEILG